MALASVLYFEEHKSIGPFRGTSLDHRVIDTRNGLAAGSIRSFTGLMRIPSLYESLEGFLNIFGTLGSAGPVE